MIDRHRWLVAVLISVCGLFLTIGTVAALSKTVIPVRAQDLRPASSIPCGFTGVAVMAANLGANPGISDTLPGSPYSRTLYFANHRSGVITISVTVTDSESCHVWGGAAFGRSGATPFEDDGNQYRLAYPVYVSHGPDTVVITSSYHVTGSLYVSLSHRVVLAFTQDIAGPLVAKSSITSSVAADHLHPLSTTLYYTDTKDAGEFFSLTGHSSDDGSGLWRTTFDAADLGCGTWSPHEQMTPDWTAEYCLRNLPPPGILTATSYDYVGNGTPVTFSHAPDGTPPTSSVTATVGRSLGGVPIEIEWAAEDAGCGIDAVTLYYRTGDGDWSQSGNVGAVERGTFDFKPPTILVTGPISYEFASVAADHLGNVEQLPGVADTTVVVHPVRLHLPCIERDYRRLLNPDFEGELNGWSTGRGPFSGHGTGIPQSAVPFEGSHRVLLGEPNAENGHLHVGYGYVAQTFTVNQPYLQFEYRVVSYDIVRGADTLRYFDNFEVSINRPPDQVPNSERNTKGCASTALNPEGTLTVAENGLVLCGGRSGSPSSTGTKWDSGWKTVRLDLGAFRGENITLYLSVWSREYTSPYYNDRGWFNTWAYVDNLRLQEQTR